MTPDSASSAVSCSPSLIAADEYAPARPRSAVITSTAARSRSRWLVSVSGWPPPVCDAAAEIARPSSRVYGRAASTRCCAFTIRDEAMSSIAFVIFLVAWTERIRRR